jgi:hypothetical protein
MKKYLAMIFAALVLVTVLAIPGLAAGGSAAVSSASAKSGETVTLIVTLSGFDPAATVGMKITTDLTMIKGDWLLPGGVLKNVDLGAKYAVWTSDGVTSVNGAALSMQFKLPDYNGVTSYSVTVSGQVKKGDEVVGTFSNTAEVKVSNPAQSISLNSNSLGLDVSVNKSATLVATLTPADATDNVEWTTSDSAVASVSNGSVTARKPGTATITATAGGKSASCVVTVTCSHANAVKTDAKEATCQATGNNAYWSCADCGKVLKADKTTTTTVAAETLPTVDHKGGTATCMAQAVCSMCKKPYGDKKAHAFSNTWESDAAQHWHLCTTCKTEKSGVANHSYEWKVDKAATEDEVGRKHEECECGSKRNENTEIPKLDHVHTGIKKHAAVAATCTKTGTVQHWTCSSSKCAGKYYQDSACQIPLDTIVEPVNANKHTGKGTYQTDENQHWKVCSDCQGIMGQKADHNWSVVYDKYPSESATGLSHETCYTCKAERNHDTVVEKLTHSPKKVEGKEATCTEDGVLEHFYCKNCKKYYESNNGKAGDQIDANSITIPALGHTFGEEWVADATGHWHVCTLCEEKSEIEAHKTELVDTVEATEEAEGYTGDEICTVCNTCVSEGTVIPVISVEETTVAPTVEPTIVPAEPATEEATMDIIVWILAAAVAVAGGAVIFFLKKRK